MAVHYRRLFFNSRDHEYVSNQWYVLLYNLHRAHIHFNVNEGHRTMARQAQLVKEKGLWSPRNPTGAARPSANAPHIRTGRPDHAIDFDNIGAVIEGARRRGVTIRQPLDKEPWHGEVNAKELKRYYRRKAAGVWLRVAAAHAKKKVRR